MAHVRSLGKLHRSFEQLVFAVQLAQKLTADGLKGVAQISWHIPLKDEWSGDPLQIDEVAKAFDREEINGNVEEILTQKDVTGTVGDLSSLKVQGDWMAVMERGFLARHATPIRCLAHAAARAAGKGHDRGVYSAGVIGFAQNLLRLGQK